MENWMGAATLAEASALSFLLALGITGLALHGLFSLIPATRKSLIPIRPVAHRAGGKGNRAARAIR